jgi:hypothetical protein
MDQCSRHDIPPAVRGDLTDQSGHDLTLGLEVLGNAVLTCWRLGNQPLKKAGLPPLGQPSRYRRRGGDPADYDRPLLLPP